MWNVIYIISLVFSMKKSDHDVKLNWYSMIFISAVMSIIIQKNMLCANKNCVIYWIVKWTFLFSRGGINLLQGISTWGNFSGWGYWLNFRLVGVSLPISHKGRVCKVFFQIFLCWVFKIFWLLVELFWDFLGCDLFYLQMNTCIKY